MKKVDHDQRRLEVAMAAAGIIAHEGLEALTTRSLAKAMNCSIGVLSHYFSNKDEIVIAAMSWADDGIETRFRGMVERGEMTVDEYEPLIIDAFPLNEQSDLEWRVRINLSAYALTHPVLLERQRNVRRERYERILALIQFIQANGNIRSDINPEMVAQTMIDFVTGTAYNLLMFPMEERRQKIDFIFPYLAELQKQPDQS